MTERLSPEQQRIVDDEVGMAERVARRVAQSLAQQAALKQPQSRGRLEAELMALRDEIAEARTEDAAALLAHMMRTAGVAAVDLPKAQGSVEPQTPYFGRLRLDEGGRKRDVLIGKRGMIDREAGVVIVDWRNAPVSRIYYRYDEGDDYEEELGEQVREGTVLVRRTLTFSRGRLLRVRCPAGTFSRRVGGIDGAVEDWVALTAGDRPELRGGVGIAARAPQALRQGERRLGLGDEGSRHDKHLPEITALIDGTQFDAMTQATSGLVILQGGAGSGKTTIALHRVAWLAYDDRGARAPERPAAFRPEHMLVVVAQRQLVRYIERLLPSLDVHGVKVMAWLDWSKAAVARVLGRSMRRVVDDVPADVARTKKHPALLLAVRTQLDRRAVEADDALAQAVVGRPGADVLLSRWAASTTTPLVPRLRAFLQGALVDLGLPPDTRERARRALQRVHDKAADVVAEWEELVTDLGLLRLTTAGPHGVDDGALATTLAHARRQVEEPPDLGDVDDLHKTPVDDPGPDPDDPTQAFDAHDLPLLLALQLARHGALVDAHGNPIAHDHVVVDEAQDLSAVELLPLVATAGERQSVTLAGDIVQKVVFDNGYDTWAELEEQLLPALAKRAVAVEPFSLSYRSTAEVVAFARAVLGPLAPAVAPQAVRSGAPVELFAFIDTGEEVAFLADNLRALMGREPQASCAVLLRYPERAKFFYDRLAEAEVPRLRLVLPGVHSADGDSADDEFSFAPGVDVTTVGKVKGLEYDYVVLVEVTEAMYPDQVAARHLLHIGATRAAHQLWVTTSLEQPSPLLPRALIQEG
ncbi:MAG: DNA helicase UvrD [Deltaproteobacteria bacterium]|nr:DNA helicase UvrD [Deltaproteobacteria bacterium]